MKPIEGMSVLITGGGSGIGEGTAELFVAKGARVTITGRRPDPLAAVAERLGPSCAWVSGDVTDDGDRRAMLAEAIEHGGGRLDTLISNAGNMYRGPIEQLDESQLLGLFHTNVVAGMMLCGLAADELARQGGCVLFVGSVHTQRAFPGASPYAATKGALEALTGVLAAELGPRGVRVGCVRPGAVESEINVRAGLATEQENRARLDSLGASHALGRIGTATEVAEGFEYLARAEWTTGAVLTVDGGLGLGVTNS